MSDPTTPPPPDATDPALTGADPAHDADPFDAIGAAAELDEALSASAPSEPGEQRGESYADILEAEVAELNTLLEARDAELGAAKEDLSRSLERVERESDRQVEQRVNAILRGFLDVLDNLDRALVAARKEPPTPAATAVIDGVELVRKSFVGKLESFGVRHDPSMGEVFDPVLHEAVSVVSTADPAQDGKVIAVVHEGYLIGDAILRPAGVIVGRHHK